MRIKTTPIAACIILMILAGNLELSAQTTTRRVLHDRDTTLTVITESFRTCGNALYARDLLTQRFGPESRQKLDALADSLAVIAISYTSGDSLVKMRAARNVVSTIVRASVATEGVRYNGAFKRLVRIFENSGDAGIRRQALNGIAVSPDQRPAALAYLRKVAISTNSKTTDAQMAVEILGNDMGIEGESVLKELWQQGQVRDRLALGLLDRIARFKEWD